MYRLLPDAEIAVIPASGHEDLIFAPANVAVARPLILDFLLRHSDSAGQTALPE
jgi:hypothetical protein